MTLDYYKKKAVLIDMTEHAHQMKEDFPEKLERETKVWSGDLFSVENKSKRLCEEKSDSFHSFAMKIIFLCKRGRMYAELGVGFLSTRTSEYSEQDHNKLLRFSSSLLETKCCF